MQYFSCEGLNSPLGVGGCADGGSGGGCGGFDDVG